MNIPSDIQPTAQEQLQALSAQFLSSLPKKLQSIGLLLDQLRTNGWSPALAQSLHREIHGLTGSGAAFGCAAVSAQARLAENTLAQILDTEAPPDASSFDTLEAHIEELNAICSQARAPNRNKAPDTATTTSTSSLDALVPPMRILVVDDDPLIRAFLNALLTAKQHQVLMAENGLQCLEIFRQESPDLIIMDVMMPDMNGYAAAQAIKAQPGHGFVPIIFLTALDSDEDLTRCVQCGGDDFLAKPINPLLLYARIFSMQRIRALYNELARYKEHTEEEIQLSRRVFDAVTQRNRSGFPGLTSWLRSAGHFSGDLFNYECTDTGQRYLMLGDFTGHGLAAAIGAVPTADIFYAMAKKNASIKDIAEEINTKLHLILPTDKFFACILLKIDKTENSVEIMNSSMPPALLLGEHPQQAAANNLPLGIVGRSSFSANCQHYPLSGTQALLLHTDGLNEAFNAGGEMYGQERLYRVIASGGPGSYIDVVKQDVEAFMNGQAADDDISLIVLDLGA